MSLNENISSNKTPLPTLNQSVRRLRYLSSFVRPHKRTFFISVVTSIAATLCVALIPFLLKHAIDSAIDTSSKQIDFSSLKLWLGLVLIAVVSQWIFSTISMRAQIWSARVVNDLRTALYAHIQRQSSDFFAKQRAGTIISRLTNDIEALEQLVNEGIFTVLVNIIYLLLIEVFLFSIHWKLAIAVNIIFPVMLLATIAFRYYSARAYRRTRERMAHVTAYLAESISGMRVMQSFAAEERSAIAFEETNSYYRRANMETIWLSAAYFPGVELLSAIGTSIVLVYAGYLGSSDAILASTIIAFILYLDNFFDPINQLSQFYGTFLSAMAALDKIMSVMEVSSSVTEPTEEAQCLINVSGDLSFNNISFHYDKDLPDVLNNIQLDVKAGEVIALVGETGAGKSTFVKLVTRFYDPTDGTISIDGVDLRKLSLSWFRKSMGIVPQEGFLFAGTVRENIAYGAPEASLDAVIAAAKVVGADKFIQQLELGYNTNVGEHGMRLSAGQRQLIAFARVILTDPPLLVLDEATSSVDVETELTLSNSMRAITKGRTAFIVAHRLSTIVNADIILVFDHGRIVEQGTQQELMALGGVFKSLYGAWSESSSSH